MTNEEIKKHLNVYIKYLESKKANINYEPTKEEEKSLSELNSEITKGDSELSRLFRFLDVSPDVVTMQKLIDEFIKDRVDVIKDEEEKDLISKIYGIDISSIDHKVLQNEKEIFAFYDPKENRKRVLENVNKESLSEQLKKKQVENEKYQTNDYVNNSETMLKDDSYENNSELKMIYIDSNDIQNGKYNYLINNLTKEELNSLKELFSKKDSLNLEYINIENQIALDKDGKILESKYNEKEGKSFISEPNTIQYTDEEMNNENQIDEKIDTIENDKPYETDEAKEEVQEEIDEEYVAEYNDMKELIKLEYETFKDSGTIDENQIRNVYNRIIKYYNEPAYLDNLTGNEKEFYTKMVEKFAEKQDEKKKLEQDESRKLKLTNPDIQSPNENAGFGYVLLLTLIVIAAFVAIIIFIIN